MICRDCRGTCLATGTTCPECAARAARSVEIDPEFDLATEIERHMLCVCPSDMGWTVVSMREPGIESHGATPRDAVAAWLSGDRRRSEFVPFGVGHEMVLRIPSGGDYADEMRAWDELRPRLLDAGILRPGDLEMYAHCTTRDDRARLATLLAQIEALAQ